MIMNEEEENELFSYGYIEVKCHKRVFQNFSSLVPFFTGPRHTSIF